MGGARRTTTTTKGRKKKGWTPMRNRHMQGTHALLCLRSHLRALRVDVIIVSSDVDLVAWHRWSLAFSLPCTRVHHRILTCPAFTCFLTFTRALKPSLVLVLLLPCTLTCGYPCAFNPSQSNSQTHCRAFSLVLSKELVHACVVS